MDDTSTKRFPGIDFLGRGFDLLLTDPLDYAKSAGQRATVIALQYGGGDVVKTDTSEYEFPIGTQVESTSGGTTDLTFQRMFRESDYSSQFGETAMVSAGVPGILSFSLSESFQQSFATSSSSTSTTLYVYREVRIAQIKFTPPQDNPPPQVMDSDFAGAVSNLPLTQGDAYQAFLQQFGTHYTTSVGMGGRAYQYTVLQASTFSQMLSTSVNVQAGASGAFEEFSGTVSGSFDSKNTTAYKTATESSTTLKNFSGGAPFDDWDKWVSSVAGSPVAIAVTLAPISDLLTSANFPSDANIGTKQSLFADAVSAYLKTGRPAPAPGTITPGSTQFALVDANGAYVSRSMGDETTGNIGLNLDPDGFNEWTAGGSSSSEILANDPLSLRTDTNSGHVDVQLQGSQLAFVMQGDNTVRPTRLVSVVEDPAQPVANTGGVNAGVVPSDIQIGDRVYVLQASGSQVVAMRSQQGALVAAASPTAGDASIIWTVTAI